MKALIIGAAGFVGAHLIAHLQQKGWDVLATKLPSENPAAQVEWHDLDIMDPTALQVLLKELCPDYIFHLAAQSSVASSWKNPRLTVDINIQGSLNLLEALRNLSRHPRILLIGSGEEYGYTSADEIPIVEETVLRPGNIYAATKATQGMLGSIYAKAYGLDIMMVRAFNHFGPGQAASFVVSDFCVQIAEIEKGSREAVIRVGNLDAERDFTDVRDVVRAYALLAENGRAGEVYNVGRGKAISIRHLLDVILASAKVSVKIEQDPARLRPLDVPIIEADIAKIRKTTGWYPEITIEQSIQDTLIFWRSRLGGKG